MRVYRIVKDKPRTTDLSGSGAFRAGGRWNSKGTYMLYTSENSSLAYLESLVHFDKSLIPSQLYIIQLELRVAAPIYTLPDKGYPANWLTVGSIDNQRLGDQWMKANRYLGIKVRSAINIMEYNYLLNPSFPNYVNLVKFVSVNEIDTDERLVQ